MESRFKGWCDICYGDIKIGESVWPLDIDAEQFSLPETLQSARQLNHESYSGRTQSKGARRWIHESCAALVHAPRPICKHWKTKGHCIFEATCIFSHPKDVQELAQRKQAELYQASIIGVDQHNEIKRRVQNRGPGKRSVVKNTFRSSTLRRFVLDTFGDERVRSGTGVLDIASGKGELAFELACLNHIQTTCIEPRTLVLTGMGKRLAYGMYHRNAVYASSLAGDAAYCMENALPIKHIPSLLTLSDNHLPSFLESEHAWKENIDAAAALSWTRKGLVTTNSSSTQANGQSHVHPGGDQVEQEAPKSDHFEAEITCVSTREEAEHLLMNASVIVGMHPDQAAGAAVDLALALNIPFAIVPCCVYSAEFPKRKLKDGRRVKSYLHLVQYLCEKHANIKTTELDFEGKNICVYWDPETDR